LGFGLEDEERRRCRLSDRGAVGCPGLPIQNPKSKIQNPFAFSPCATGGQDAELRHGAWFGEKPSLRWVRRFPREVVKRIPATGSPRTRVVRTFSSPACLARESRRDSGAKRPPRCERRTRPRDDRRGRPLAGQDRIHYRRLLQLARGVMKIKPTRRTALDRGVLGQHFCGLDYRVVALDRRIPDRTEALFTVTSPQSGHASG
jgi:hypothetical protein